MLKLVRSIVCVYLLGLLFVAAVRADWPEFRGATGQGHSLATGLPVNWSETENIRWKTEIDGLAWSSPVVAGDHIYVTSAVPRAENQVDLKLICLDSRTGEFLWQKTIFEHDQNVRMHKKNSHASPTPIIAGETIYAHFGPHGTARLTLDGELVWKQKLEYAPVHGNGGSPALADDVLVICCDGGDTQYVVGLETDTGEIRWKTNRETDPQKGFSFSTPLVIGINGQQQAICPGSDAVFAYDPQTGREIWRVDYPGGYSVTPRPVFGNGLVFVCTGFQTPRLLAIDPTGSGNVTETHLRWSTDRGVPHSPSVLLVDQNIYFVSDKGIASCLDARTGQQHWQERLGGNFSASPLFADGRIYFQDENGQAIVLRADASFEELSRNRLTDEERTFASYAVDGSALLIRTETALYRVQTP